MQHYDCREKLNNICICQLCTADKAGGGGVRNGGYSVTDNRQRLLAEEAELDRMVKELEATLPPSEGEIRSP